MSKESLIEGMSSCFKELIRSYVTVLISGDECIRFLNICKSRGLNFDNLKQESAEGIHNITFVTDYFNVREIKEVVAKCNLEYKLVEITGYVKWFENILRYRMKLIGLAIGLMLMLLASLVIWNIRIEGNFHYTDEQICAALAKIDVNVGTSKNNIKLSDIEKSIRESMKNIYFVSAKIEGTTLLIDIKENDEAVAGGFVEQENYIKKRKGENIKALYDGSVKSIVTRNGTAVVKQGDKVKKGDIIIEGKYNLYNDAGENTEKIDVIPKGVVVMEVEIRYKDEITCKCISSEHKNCDNCYQLSIFGKNINIKSLFKHKKNDENTVIIDEYNEFNDVIGKILKLKLTISKEFQVKRIERKYNDEEIAAIFEERFKLYLEKNYKKSIQIIKNNVKIRNSGNRYIAEGNISALVTLNYN